MRDARETCYTCFRPRVVCICAFLQPVANRTRITIVQHPRERLHPLNTARIAEGSLESVRVLRGTLGRLKEELGAGAIPADAWLLYPGPNAVDLETLPADQAPREVVVLDGTWHQASTLLRDLPALASLPCARFTPAAPSEYRIRKEPRADYHSTIESIAHVLSVLEPDTAGIESLRESFRQLVARNVAARPPSRTRRARQRDRRAHAFPDELSLPLDQVVLAYAEGAFIRTPERRKQPLVAWLSHPESGARLRILLRPRGQVGPRLLQALELNQDELEREGFELDGAEPALRAFLGERALVAWNASTLAMLAELGARPMRRLLLKGAYCDHRRSLGERPAAWGNMNAILAVRGVSWHSRGGRAERGLAQTDAIYGYLRKVARSNVENAAARPAHATPGISPSGPAAYT